MLKTIINYVNYKYQLCENIDSSFLSSNINTNECFIKSCLVYQNLHEIYNRGIRTVNRSLFSQRFSRGTGAILLRFQARGGERSASHARRVLSSCFALAFALACRLADVQVQFQFAQTFQKPQRSQGWNIRTVALNTPFFC